jgi:hypothetical protein
MAVWKWHFFGGGGLAALLVACAPASLFEASATQGGSTLNSEPVADSPSEKFTNRPVDYDALFLGTVFVADQIASDSEARVVVDATLNRCAEFSYQSYMRDNGALIPRRAITSSVINVGDYRYYIRTTHDTGSLLDLLVYLGFQVQTRDDAPDPDRLIDYSGLWAANDNTLNIYRSSGCNVTATFEDGRWRVRMGVDPNTQISTDTGLQANQALCEAHSLLWLVGLDAYLEIASEPQPFNRSTELPDGAKIGFWGNRVAIPLTDELQCLGGLYRALPDEVVPVVEYLRSAQLVMSRISTASSEH